MTQWQKHAVNGGGIHNYSSSIFSSGNWSSRIRIREIEPLGTYVMTPLLSLKT